ncbi:hypothetical protein [Micromonospora sp. NPDC004551]|uniref:hypothetical protein n=1 Tax=Micromonospora sp. NPDC004551 TaxID=3154284 RepID=UPI0033B4977A
MAGWSAMAGTNDFEVPGEEQARDLVEALSTHGFAYVTARPSPRGGWLVTVLDEGPYPVDTVGHRTIEAVASAAGLIAREHGGYAAGGSRFDVSRLPSYREAQAPVVRTNPGTRPPIPTVVVVPPPPSAPLALTPDIAVEDVPIDLSGLDDVPWAELSHAHGSAEDIPGLLRELADPYGDWDEILDELFGDDLLHQGTCYSATAPALPYLSRLIRSGALPARQRLHLHAWLLIAAGRLGDGLIAGAEVALVHGEPPEPASWTEEVYRAVDRELPALLRRWEVEVPAVRFVLAALAGLYPVHGRQVVGRITAMAEEFEGTRAGAYLRLAEALVQGRDESAGELAAAIVAWEDDLDPDWLDAPGVGVAVRAGQVLTEGGLRTLSDVERAAVGGETEPG